MLIALSLALALTLPYLISSRSVSGFAAKWQMVQAFPLLHTINVRLRIWNALKKTF